MQPGKERFTGSKHQSEALAPMRQVHPYYLPPLTPLLRLCCRRSWAACLSRPPSSNPFSLTPLPSSHHHHHHTPSVGQCVVIGARQCACGPHAGSLGPFQLCVTAATTASMSTPPQVHKQTNKQTNNKQTNKQRMKEDRDHNRTRSHLSPSRHHLSQQHPI